MLLSVYSRTTAVKSVELKVVLVQSRTRTAMFVYLKLNFELQHCILLSFYVLFRAAQCSSSSFNRAGKTMQGDLLCRNR